MEVARSDGSPVAAGDQPIFYYDLGDPECYLAAEQVMSALPTVPEWEPVWARQVVVGEAGRLSRRSVHSFAPPRVQRRLQSQTPELWRGALERRAAALALQPVRWPEPWPPDSRDAMLAATYAKRIGRAVAFSLAAFRQAFAGGRDLGDRDTVLIAGAACEMHPAALLKGIALRSVHIALEQAGARAHAAGVSSLPAIQVGGQVFQVSDQGFDREGLIEAAAGALASRAAR